MAEKRHGYVNANIHGMKNVKLILEVKEEELRSSSDNVEVIVRGKITGKMVELFMKSPPVIEVRPESPISKEGWEEVKVSIEIDNYMGEETRLRIAASVIAGAIFSAIDIDLPKTPVK